MILVEWQKVLLIWVNALGVLLVHKEPIDDLLELSNGLILRKIIDLIQKKNPRRKLSHLSDKKLIEAYFSKEFPKLNHGHPFDLNCKRDLISITSCLMYASSVTHDIPDVKKELLKLNDDLQSLITTFFKILLETSNLEITQEDVESAITNIPECDVKSNETPKKTPLRLFTSGSTGRSSFSSPINEFFQSPIMQKKLISDKEKEIMRLKKQLDEEEEEVNKITEKNKILSNEVDNLQTEMKAKILELEAKKEEIKMLKGTIKDLEDLLQNQAMPTSNNEPALKSEIESLQKMNAHLESKMCSLEKKLSAASIELNKAKEEKQIWFEHFQTLNNKKESLDKQVVELQEKNVDLQTLVNFQEQRINDLRIPKKEEVSTNEPPMSIESELMTIKFTETANELKECQEKCAALTVELKELNDKFNTVYSENNKTKDLLKKTESELQSTAAKVTDEKKKLSDVLSKTELQLQASAKEIKSLQSVIQEKERNISTLTDEKQKLSDTLSKSENDIVCLNKVIEDFHSGDYEKKIKQKYEDKLQSLKTKMKSICNEGIIKIKDQHEKQLQQYKEKITKDQAHIEQLSSQLWDTNNKLLSLKQEKELQLPKKTKKYIQMAPPRTPISSLDQLSESSRGSRKRLDSTNYAGEASSSRRGTRNVPSGLDSTNYAGEASSSRRGTRNVPSGLGKKLLSSGKVFPPEDEVGEVFGDTYLSEMMAGHCKVASSEPDRLSTLQYRNSLCPPHLKSSYPAETQFLDSSSVREDDIKEGLLLAESDGDSLLSGNGCRMRPQPEAPVEKTEDTKEGDDK